MFIWTEVREDTNPIIETLSSDPTNFKNYSILLMRVYPLIVAFCFLAEFVAAQKISTHIYKQYQGDTLSLDVYEPEQDSRVKRSVIILFHGGGLVSGTRDAMKKQCAFFAERGLVAVSPSYHLIPKKTKNTCPYCLWPTR